MTREERDALVLKLRSEGKGYRKIGQETGVSHRTIRRVFDRHGDPCPNDYAPPVQWDADMDATLIRMRTNKRPWEETASEIGVAMETARARLRKLVPADSALFQHVGYARQMEWQG